VIKRIRAWLQDAAPALDHTATVAELVQLTDERKRQELCRARYHESVARQAAREACSDAIGGWASVDVAHAALDALARARAAVADHERRAGQITDPP
jgi:hypothetical protein